MVFTSISLAGTPLLSWLIICPLVFLAALIDAIAGGGGLISLPAYLIGGVPVHSAIATNKLSACMGTSVATGNYIRNGFVNWKAALPAIPMALLGAALGAELALQISSGSFQIIMLILLPCTGIYILRGHSFDSVKEPLAPSKTIVISMAAALGIGVYDGFYGPGTGTFLILLLTGLAHMRLETANGVTKVINLSTNISGLVVFFLNDKVLIALGLTAGLFSMAGAKVGATYFKKSGANGTKPVMILVLAIFFVKTLYEVLH